jgi:hypothetical protein
MRNAEGMEKYLNGLLPKLQQAPPQTKEELLDE